MLVLVFICVFCICNSALSLPAGDYSVPSDLGIVKEAFDAPSGNKDCARMIIHIQDAHCNYEAQKNMAGILEHLVENYNLKLVMVEGGNGNVNLDFLRSYADKISRQEIADKYLKMGKISGEEYLDIVSDYDIELYGIDDEPLYDMQLDNFSNIDKIREKCLQYVKKLSGVVSVLKPFIYSEQLRQLEEKKSKYKENAFSLADYSQYLTEIIINKGMKLKAYPQISKFCRTVRLEKDIDFQLAEQERNTFVKDIAGLLDEAGVNELINMTKEFKEKNISAQEYYTFLKFISEEKVDLKSYPHLNNYVDYLTLSKDIEAKSLLEEISQAEKALFEAYLTNNEQRELRDIDKALKIISRMLNLELTPDGYTFFKVNKHLFHNDYWINFLNRSCAKYNLPEKISPSNIIDANLNLLEEFYRLGTEREKAFIKNVVKKMNDSDENIAVLITGGFHTLGITRGLKSIDYSYLVVAPIVSVNKDSSIYFSVLREERKQNLE